MNKSVYHVPNSLNGNSKIILGWTECQISPQNIKKQRAKFCKAHQQSMMPNLPPSPKAKLTCPKLLKTITIRPQPLSTKSIPLIKHFLMWTRASTTRWPRRDRAITSTKTVSNLNQQALWISTSNSSLTAFTTTKRTLFANAMLTRIARWQEIYRPVTPRIWEVAVALPQTTWACTWSISLGQK